MLKGYTGTIARVGLSAEKVSYEPLKEEMARKYIGGVGLAAKILAGERIFNLKRMFSVRRRISRKDDTLPARILTHKLTEGGTKRNLPFLGFMLNEYYSTRGWNEEGIPTREKLHQLSLKECL